MIVGNILDADKRRARVEWAHSAIDPAAIVRDFVKWDDQPASLQHFAESAVRAYKIAMTPPMGPVLLSLDAELQENPIPNRAALRIPQADAGGPAARRQRARSTETAQAAGQGGKSGDHRRPRWRAPRPAWTGWSSWPRRCNAR